MSWEQPRRIYAAEFKCGVVKVGITKQPGEGRGATLRFRDAAPLRMFYGKRHECGSWAERELIHRLRRMATAIEGREWFVGIHWPVAVQLVNQVTSMAIALSERTTAKA